MTIEEKIKQAIENARVAPFGWYRNLKDLEEDVLKILEGYAIMEKQKLRELADLLKHIPNATFGEDYERDSLILWSQDVKKKFVEAFGESIKKET